MELNVSQANGYFLAKTNGPIDESADEPFQEHLYPLVGTGGTRVIVDLSQSPRINSRGLSFLVTLVTRANTSKSRVVFCGVPPFVAGVFSVTKLDQFFEIAADEATAISRWSQT